MLQSNVLDPDLFNHGDMDINVDIGQSRRMDKALRNARDMLRKSEAFLRAQLKL